MRSVFKPSGRLTLNEHGIGVGYTVGKGRPAHETPSSVQTFPTLGQEELRELADDITSNGLQNAIILLDGKILDGRNRHAACKIAKVEPRFEKWKGKGSPVEWVISQNLMRH